MKLFFRSSYFSYFPLLEFCIVFCVALFIRQPAQGSHQIPSVSLETTDRTRFLALMLLNLPRERGIDADLITLGHNSGMNAVYLTIPWNYVYYESPTEPPNWAKYDEQIAIATSLGMKVAIRIHLGRHNSRLKGFWDLKDSPVDGRNTPLISGYGDTYFRFNYEPALLKAIAFVKEVTARYKFLQDQNDLLFVSVTNTTEHEAGYNTSGYYEEKLVPSLYDYSPEIIYNFRTWLRDNYGKIERLNAKWRTTYKSFQDPYPPYAHWEPSESFTSRYGKDWYIIRHLNLREFVEKMVDAVKSIDSTIKYIGDYGSVFDELSPLRGTLGFKDLNRKADGIKINDGLTGTDHRFSVDILRSQSPAHFLVANEVFYTDWAQNFEHTKQVDENFQHGANLVAVLISTINSMQRAEPFIKEVSSRWLTSPVVPITYADTVSYLLSEAVDKGSASRVVYSAYMAKAYADPKSPKPVYINLQEDLFTDEYWKNASNQKPIIAHAPEAQTVAVNRSFKYKIPETTFADPDGRMAKIEVSNLPGWLSYKDGDLTGTPPALGVFSVTVTGFDDEGGKISTPLVINVVVPNLQFELVAGGNLDSTQRLRILKGGEIIPYESLPHFINVIATSNFDFETIYFELKGAYGKKSASSEKPYSLVKSINGFSPFVGRYRLTARTESDGTTILTKSIDFSISYGDSSDIAKNIEALQFYPNPVESVLNIKLPNNPPPQDLEFIIIHSTGRAVRIQAPHISIADRLANIDLAGAGIPAGTYILQLRTKQTLIKQFKLFKY